MGEMSSNDISKPSNKSTNNENEGQSDSFSMDATKQEKNKQVKEASKEGDKVKLSNDAQTKEKDFKHSDELDKHDKDTYNKIQNDDVSSNKQKGVVSKETNEVAKTEDDIHKKCAHESENKEIAENELVDESSAMKDSKKKSRK